MFLHQVEVVDGQPSLFLAVMKQNGDVEVEMWDGKKESLVLAQRLQSTPLPYDAEACHCTCDDPLGVNGPCVSLGGVKSSQSAANSSKTCQSQPLTMVPSHIKHFLIKESRDSLLIASFFSSSSALKSCSRLKRPCGTCCQGMTRRQVLHRHLPTQRRPSRPRVCKRPQLRAVLHPPNLR